MMKDQLRRLLALVLSVMMLCGNLPMTAIAEGIADIAGSADGEISTADIDVESDAPGEAADPDGAPSAGEETDAEGDGVAAIDVSSGWQPFAQSAVMPLSTSGNSSFDVTMYVGTVSPVVADGTVSNLSAFTASETLLVTNNASLYYVVAIRNKTYSQLGSGNTSSPITLTAEMKFNGKESTAEDKKYQNAVSYNRADTGKAVTDSKGAVNGDGRTIVIPANSTIYLYSKGGASVATMFTDGYQYGTEIKNEIVVEIPGAGTVTATAPVLVVPFTVEKLISVNDSDFHKPDQYENLEPGDTVQYQINIRNLKDNDAISVKWADQAEHTAGWRPSLQLYTDDNASAEAANPITVPTGSDGLSLYSGKYTVGGATGVNFINTVTVTDASDSRLTASDSVSVPVKEPGPRFTVKKYYSIDGGAYQNVDGTVRSNQLGKNIAYRVVVENTGTIPIDIQLRDVLTFDNATIDGGAATQLEIVSNNSGIEYNNANDTWRVPVGVTAIFESVGGYKLPAGDLLKEKKLVNTVSVTAKSANGDVTIPASVAVAIPSMLKVDKAYATSTNASSGYSDFLSKAYNDQISADVTKYIRYQITFTNTSSQDLELRVVDTFTTASGVTNSGADVLAIDSDHSGSGVEWKSGTNGTGTNGTLIIPARQSAVLYSTGYATLRKDTAEKTTFTNKIEATYGGKTVSDELVLKVVVPKQNYWLGYSMAIANADFPNMPASSGNMLRPKDGESEPTVSAPYYAIDNGIEIVENGKTSGAQAQKYLHKTRYNEGDVIKISTLTPVAKDQSYQFLAWYDKSAETFYNPGNSVIKDSRAQQTLDGIWAHMEAKDYKHVYDGKGYKVSVTDVSITGELNTDKYDLDSVLERFLGTASYYYTVQKTSGANTEASTTRYPAGEDNYYSALPELVTRTDAGEYQYVMYVRITPPNGEPKTITATAKLTITPRPLTITVATSEYRYDGLAHKVAVSATNAAEYTATGVISGDSLDHSNIAVTYQGANGYSSANGGVEVGEYTAAISDSVIEAVKVYATRNGEKVDVTSNYEKRLVNGKLTITTEGLQALTIHKVVDDAGFTGDTFTFNVYPGNDTTGTPAQFVTVTENGVTKTVMLSPDAVVSGSTANVTIDLSDGTKEGSVTVYLQPGENGPATYTVVETNTGNIYAVSYSETGADGSYQNTPVSVSGSDVYVKNTAQYYIVEHYVVDLVSKTGDPVAKDDAGMDEDEFKGTPAVPLFYTLAVTQKMPLTAGATYGSEHAKWAAGTENGYTYKPTYTDQGYQSGNSLKKKAKDNKSTEDRTPFDNVAQSSQIYQYVYADAAHSGASGNNVVRPWISKYDPNSWYLNGHADNPKVTGVGADTAIPAGGTVQVYWHRPLKLDSKVSDGVNVAISYHPNKNTGTNADEIDSAEGVRQGYTQVQTHYALRKAADDNTAYGPAIYSTEYQAFYFTWQSVNKVDLDVANDQKLLPAYIIHSISARVWNNEDFTTGAIEKTEVISDQAAYIDNAWQDSHVDVFLAPLIVVEYYVDGELVDSLKDMTGYTATFDQLFNGAVYTSDAQFELARNGNVGTTYPYNYTVKSLPSGMGTYAPNYITGRWSLNERYGTTYVNQNTSREAWADLIKNSVMLDTTGKYPVIKLYAETVPPYSVSKTVTFKDGSAITEKGVKAGDVLTYTITIENNDTTKTIEKLYWKDVFTGAGAKGAMTVTAVPSDGATWSLETTPWEITNLKPGAKLVVTYDYTVDEADRTIENTATVDDDANLDEDKNDTTPPQSSGTKTPVRGWKVDKAVSGMTGENGTARVGDKLVYTVTVTNTGDVELKNLTVADNKVAWGSLNPKAQIVIKDGKGETVVAAADFTGTIASLAKGQTAVITYQVTVAAGARIVNVVTVPDGPDDTDPDHQSTKTTDVEAWSITKSLAKVNDATDDLADVKVKAGDVITYAITVENTGSTELNGLTVTDTLTDLGGAYHGEAPVYVNKSSTLASSKAEFNGQTLNKLSVGEKVTLYFTYTVAVGDAYLSNVAKAEKPKYDKDNHPTEDQDEKTSEPVDRVVYGDVYVVKKWLDSAGQPLADKFTSPVEVQLQSSADGTAYADVPGGKATLRGTDRPAWTHVFSDMPLAVKNGDSPAVRISYRVLEIVVPQTGDGSQTDAAGTAVRSGETVEIGEYAFEVDIAAPARRKDANQQDTNDFEIVVTNTLKNDDPDDNGTEKTAETESPSGVKIGDTVTYTIKRTSHLAQVGVARIIDTLPEGLTFDAAAANVAVKVDGVAWTLWDAQENPDRTGGVYTQEVQTLTGATTGTQITWLVYNVPPMAEVEITYTVTVNAKAINTQTKNADNKSVLTNTASVGFATNPQGDFNADEDSTDVVVLKPELEIVKTAVKGSSTITTVKPGDQFTYRLTVTNKGPGKAENVVVEDALPEGLELQLPDSAVLNEEKGAYEWLLNGSKVVYAIATRTITWTVASMAEANPDPVTATLDLPVKVNGDEDNPVTNAAGTVLTQMKNVAKITGGYDPENPPEESEKEVKVADFTVVKSVELPIDPETGKEKTKASLDDVLEYTITVTNVGGVALENVTIMDDKFVSAIENTLRATRKADAASAAVDLAVTLAGSTITIGEMAAGEIITITYRYQVTEADIQAAVGANHKNIINIATVEATDPTDPTGKIEKKDSTEVEPDAPSPEWSVSKAAAVTRQNASVDVSDGTVPVWVNEIITFTITVTNTGNVTLDKLTVEDVLRSDENPLTGKVGATGKSSLCGDEQHEESAHAAFADWTITNLAPGESMEITYTYQVTQNDMGATLNNVVTVSDPDKEDDPDDPDDDPPSSGTTTPVDKWTVVKKVGTGHGDAWEPLSDSQLSGIEGVPAGTTLVYHIEITNDTDHELNGLVLTDTLTVKAGETEAAGALTFKALLKAAGSKAEFVGGNTVNGLGARETVILEYEYTVKSAGNDSDAGKLIENKASVSGGPETTVTTKVDDYDMVKAVSGLVANGGEDKNGNGVLEEDEILWIAVPGTELTYTITVENKGDTVLNGLLVSDVLKAYDVSGAQVDAVSFDWSEIEFTVTGIRKDDAVANGTELTLNNVPVGGTVVITYKYTVPEDTDAVRLVNAAVAREDNDRHEDTVETPVGQWSVRKERTAITDASGNARTEAHIGDTLTYTITITNEGSVALNALVLSDALNGETFDLRAESANLQIVAADAGKAALDKANLTLSGLQPGDAVRLTYTYTVAATDTYLANVITASEGGHDESGNEPTVVYVDVVVVKQWKNGDNENLDPALTSDIGVCLWQSAGDAAPYRTAKLTKADGTWRTVFSNLPAANGEGVAYAYTVTENDGTETGAAIGHGGTLTLGAYSFDVTISGDQDTATSNFLYTITNKLKDQETPQKPEKTADEADPAQGANDGVAIGDSMTYTIERVSHLNAKSTATITDTLPVGLDFNDPQTETITVTVNGTAATGFTPVRAVTKNADGTTTVRWVIADVPPMAKVTIVYQTTVNKDAIHYEKLDNTVSFDFGENDTDDDFKGATETVDVLKPALSVEKDATAEVVKPGEKFSYTLTVTNSGAGRATDVKVVDTLPKADVTVDLEKLAELYGAGEETATDIKWTIGNDTLVLHKTAYTVTWTIAALEAMEGDEPAKAELTIPVKVNVKSDGYLVNKTFRNTVRITEGVPCDPDSGAPVPPTDGRKYEDSETTKVADIRIAKRTTNGVLGDDAYYELGFEIEYEITVTNIGDVPLKDVKVTDAMLAKAVKDDNGQLKFKVTKAGQTIAAAYDAQSHTVTVGDLAVGESATITYYYAITEEDVASETDVTNIAKVNAKFTDTEDGSQKQTNEHESKVELPADPNPLWTVVKSVTGKSGPDGVTEGDYARVGDTLTYAITITNIGNITLDKLEIVDVDFNGTGDRGTPAWASDWEEESGTAFSTENGWILEGLAPGESGKVTYTYVVQPEDVGMTLTNTAVVKNPDVEDDPDDPDDDPPSDTTETDVEKWSVTKSVGVMTDGVWTDLNELLEADEGVAVGTKLYYHITVTNESDHAVRSLVLKDTLLSGGTAVAADKIVFKRLIRSAGSGASFNRNTNTLDNLAAGESVTIELEYAVTEADAGKALSNTAVVGNVTSNTVTTKVDDYEVSKSVTGTVDDGVALPGTRLTYTITITNKGETVLNGLIVVDELNGETIDLSDATLASGLEDSEASFNGETLSGVAPGETVTLTYTYDVPGPSEEAPDALANAVTVTDDGHDETGTDDTPVGKWSVDKALTKVNGADVTDDTKPKANDVLTYTITVTNIGQVDLKELRISDKLAGGSTANVPAYAPGSAVSSVAGRTPDFADGVLAELVVGETVTLTYTYTVQPNDVYLSNVAIVGKGDPENPDEPSHEEESDEVDTPIYVAVKVTKVWLDGDGNALNDTLKSDIVVALLRDGTATGDELTMTRGNAWTVEFTGLQAADALNHAYRYTVSEKGMTTADGKTTIKLDGHTFGVTVTGDQDATASYAYEFTNKLQNGTPNDAEKTAKEAAQQIGERITYQVSRTSHLATASTATIIDTMPPELSYVTGSATAVVMVNGEAVTDKTFTLLESIEGKKITWTIEDVPPMATVTVTYQATVLDVAVDAENGKIKNKASVGFDSSFRSDENEVDVLLPALTISKTSNPANVKPGDELTYTLTVTNTGDGRATGVVVRDTLPGEVTLIGESLRDDCEVTADASGHTVVVWNVGTIEVDGSAEMTFKVRVNATPTKDSQIGHLLDEDNDPVKVFTNSAAITEGVPPLDPDMDPDDPEENPYLDDEDTTVADIRVVKRGKDDKGVIQKDQTVDDRYDAGDLITYTVTVTNIGGVAVRNITVTDEKFAVAKDGVVMVTINGTTKQAAVNGNAIIIEDELAAGAKAVVTYVYEITQADIDDTENKIANIARATAEYEPNDDPNEPPAETNESKDDEEMPADPEPELDIEKSVTITRDGEPVSRKKARVGDTLVFEIVVMNIGNVTLENVIVTDDMLANRAENIRLDGQSCTPLDGNKVVIGTLEVDASAVITYTCEVTEDDIKAGRVRNVATVIADDPSSTTDPKEQLIPKRDTTTTPTENLDTTLTVVKVSEATLVAPGDVIAYTITVTNDGNVTFTNVRVEDGLEGLTITNAVSSVGKTDIRWTDHAVMVDELFVGETVTITATYPVTEADVLKGHVYNLVMAEADPMDDPQHPGEQKTPEGKDDEDDDVIGLDPTLTVTKTSDVNGTASLGDTITYTIAVKNDGNVSFDNVVVKDGLTGLRITKAESSVTGKTIPHTDLSPVVIEKLEVGETVTITAAYTVTEADILAGHVYNAVTAEADPVPNPDYNPDEPDDPTDNPPTITPEGEDDQDDDTDGLDPTLTVTKTSDVKDTASLGDTITYTITVKNDGNVSFDNVVVKDGLTGLRITKVESSITGKTIPHTDLSPVVIEKLEVGETVTITAAYTVTEADILAGHVYNAVTAEADPVPNPDYNPDEPDDPTDNPPTITPEGEDDQDDDTDDLDPTLTVTKTSDVKDTASLGDTITYTITVKNDGNVSFDNVVVKDGLTGLTITKVESSVTGKTIPHTDLSPVVIEKLEVGETVTITAAYTVTEADILAGHVYNAVTAEADPVPNPDYNPDEPDDPTDNPPTITPEGEDDQDDDTDDLDPTLTVTKTSDVNGTASLGDTITYTITVKNDGNVSFDNVVVKDGLTGLRITKAESSITGKTIPHTDLSPVVIEKLEVGETVTITAAYTVTEADILTGHVYNAVTAEADPVPNPDYNPDEPDDPTDNPPTITPQGEDDQDDDTSAKAGSLKVVKTITNAPANGTGYVVGETITYAVTVTNDGNVTITDVRVTDELTGDLWTVPSLAPGESRSFTTSYVVKQADVLAGKVLNVATATGKSPDPEHPDVTSDPAEAVTGTETKRGHLNVLKFVTNIPKNGRAYTQGETIMYRIRVTNDGNLTLTEIKVTDKLTGDEWTIPSLAPGESTVFTTAYTVTAADAQAGSVLNVATAKGKSPDPDKPTVYGESEVSRNTEPGAEESKTASYRLNKTATNIPERGYYLEGETVTYIVTVLNTGTVAINNFVLTDALDGAKVVAGAGYTVKSERQALIPKLEAGQHVDVQVTYRITKEDVKRGSVRNVASGYGTDPDGKPVEGNVTEITVPTDDTLYNVVVHYYYLEDGTQAAPDQGSSGLRPGETYEFTSPELEGYVATIVIVTGTMPAHDVEITVFYVRVSEIEGEVVPPIGTSLIEIDEYGVPLHLGNITRNVGDCFE